MKKHVPLSWRKPVSQRPRFALPNSIWECRLKAHAFVILSYLYYRAAHGRSESVTPEVIADDVHMAASTVKKYLLVLADRGFVVSAEDPAPTLPWAASGNFFSLPDEIFLLRLPPSAFLVYACLLSREDRRTHQCRPSYRTIKAVTGQAAATVIRAVGTLAELGLIRVEETRRFDEHRQKWKDNNLYTVLPIRPVMDEYHHRELHRMELDAERERVRRRQVEYDRRHPRAPLCGAGSIRLEPCPTGDCEAPVEALRGTKKKAWRRKRPPAGSHLPAVRAVYGGFRGVGSGVYLQQKNGPWRLDSPTPPVTRG